MKILWYKVTRAITDSERKIHRNMVREGRVRTSSYWELGRRGIGDGAGT